MKGYKIKNKNYYKRKKHMVVKWMSGIVIVSGIVVAEQFINPTQGQVKKIVCDQGKKLKLPVSTVIAGGNPFVNVDDIVVKEKPKVYVGTNEEGQAYAYDANIIAEKLRKYDYSNNGEKIVFLTFDDGVSTTVTPKVLDILDQYDVKATFFLVGSNIEKGGEESYDLVRRVFNDGHAIGNHSYSHDYSVLYPGRYLNLNNFVNEFDKNEQLIKDILGVDFSTRVLRCPGGHMSWNNMDELDQYLVETNKISIDWNALSKDAEGPKKDANQLLQEVKNTAEGKEIVVLLMHDTYGKEATAEALPEIIEYFKGNGYSFKTLI